LRHEEDTNQRNKILIPKPIFAREPGWYDEAATIFIRDPQNFPGEQLIRRVMLRRLP
jgi:hypothetical protein